MNLSQRTLQDIHPMEKENTTLEELYLNGNDFGHTFGPQFFSVFNISSIRKLSLLGCGLTHVSLEGPLSCLETLILGSNNLIYFADHQIIPSLKNISMTSPPDAESAVDVISNIAHVGPNITNLDISDSPNESTSSGIVMVLPLFFNVIELGLRNVPLTSSINSGDLVSCLEGYSETLECLTLNCCKIDDICMSKILKCLTNTLSLVKLDLSCLFPILQQSSSN